MKYWLIDVDDVICNLTTTLIQVLNRRFNKNLKDSDITTYNLSEIYGCHFGEILKCFKEDIDWMNLPLKHGALEGLKLLKCDPEVHIHVCTARWFIDKEITQAYLEKMNVPFDVLMVTSAGNVKSEMYQDRGVHYEAMIDDHYMNLVDAVHSGIVKERYLVNMPHNRQQQMFFRNGKSIYECVLKHQLQQ